MQEIFLGARRPPRPGRLARKLAIAGLIVAIASLIVYVVFNRITSVSAPSGSAPPGSLTVDGNRVALAGSSLERVGDLWVLRLAGEPFTMGYSAARLAGRLVGDGGAALDVAIYGEEPRSGLGGFVDDLRARWRYRLLSGGMTEERRAELAGLAAGWQAAGLPLPPNYQRLMWREAALDIGRAPGSVAPTGGIASGLAFVLGGGASLGRVVVGRNFDLAAEPRPSPTVVSFVRPVGDLLAFARIGWSGEVGAVTGINSESIAICVDPAVTEDVRPDRAAPPIAQVGRDLLERAHNLDEAIALLQAARPLGSASYLIVDGKASTWAVVERSPTKISITRSKKPVAIGDVLVGADFAKDADNERARRTRPGSARLARLVELLGRTAVAEPAVAASILRDRRGKGDVRLPLGSGNALDDFVSGHVAIIDVTSLMLWVGEGPGAAGPMRAFDLRHELLGEPSRVGAQAPLAPDPTLDLAVARSTALGAAQVEAAARSMRLGRYALAAEQVVRALALAPELAEAHKLAGDLAREQGEASNQAEHYRRYLELGPADPTAESEARAALGGP